MFVVDRRPKSDSAVSFAKDSLFTQPIVLLSSRLLALPHITVCNFEEEGNLMHICPSLLEGSPTKIIVG